jgi:hypothetical protein
MLGKKETPAGDALVVYTAVTGGYDTLLDPATQSHLRNKPVAFVDPSFKAGAGAQAWELRPACAVLSEANRNAKVHKVLAHQYFPDVQYTLWVDGNIQIVSCFPPDLAETWLDGRDVAVFAHPSRVCAYSEAAKCLECGLDDPQRIMDQVIRYTRDGFAAGLGLAQGGIMLRRHTPRTVAFNECWWDEICAGSRRDQISLMYAAYKTQVQLRFLPSVCHRFFQGRAHAKPHGRVWSSREPAQLAVGRL